MFAKVLFYDFKETGEKILPLYLVTLITSILSAVLSFFEFSFLTSLFYGLAVIMTVVTVAATFFIHILHYNRSLYKDEAYLNHTLPVSQKSLFFSKLLTAYLWTICTFIILLVIEKIAYLVSGSYQGMFSNIFIMFKLLPFSTLFWIFLGFTLTTLSMYTLFFYSITVGKSSFLRRFGAGGPILTYLGTYVLEAIFAVLAMLYIPFSVLIPGDNSIGNFLTYGNLEGFKIPGFGPAIFRFESMMGYLRETINNTASEEYIPLGLGFVLVYLVFFLLMIFMTLRTMRKYQEL